MNIFMQLAVSGLMLGGLYALMSIGLTLIFGTMRVVNFAHGEFLMLGMYAAYFLWRYWDVDPYLSVFVVAPAGYAVGYAVERLVIRHTIGGLEVTQIFATLGLSILLQNGALFAFSADPRTVKTAITTATLDIGGIRIPMASLISSVVAVALAIALWAFLQRTMAGAAIRATAQQRDAAALVGINVSRTYAVTFALGTAGVAVAGALVTPVYALHPRIGTEFLLIAFVIVVLGGLGSVKGAFAGSIIVGLLVSFASYFFGSTNAQLAYFLLFILVLVIKPAGLFGQRGAEVYQQ